MLDTLTIIRDVMQISDNVVAMSATMIKEELMQKMIRIDRQIDKLL